MDYLNFILIGFIIALTLLSLWWAFNTIRQIEIQKTFCAEPLSSIAKLWRRAQFVPEDAKDRESLYLYRDFLRKFHESECKYPIMVKNGGVRCMTRKEFDDLCGQQNKRPFSILILVASVLVALVALIVNIAVTKTIAMGIGLALIMPAVQIALSFFVMRFNKEKNAYREAIFKALKENSVNFLSITKPFIIVDAYPTKFGKTSEPLYASKGELTAEQIEATRAFIVRQKEAETEVVLRNVDNKKEIEQINNPQPVVEEPAPVATPTNAEQPTAANPAEAEIDPANLPPLSDEEKTILINNLIDDTLQAEVERAVKKAAEAEQAPAPVEELPPLPTDAVAEPVAEIATPDADDFSLDSISQALDAEIAQRNKKK